MGVKRSSGRKPAESKPEFVLVMGPVACGKTRFRRESFSSGYVHLDAGEIFIKLCRGMGLSDDHDFPSDLEGLMEVLGQELASRAIAERRNIVTEIIGDSQENLRSLTAAMKAAGYSCDGKTLTCRLEESEARNRARSADDISAYFTQKYHQKWLETAAAEFASGKSSIEPLR